MKTNGIEFFPYPSTNSTALQLLFAKFEEKGIFIYISLLQKIFSEEGYYFEITEKVLTLLCHELRTEEDTLLAIIDECVDNELFDKSMYQKHNILTSNEIQKEYLYAIKRRKNIKLNKEYCLSDAKEHIKNVASKEKMHTKNAKMYAENEKMYTKIEKMYTILDKQNKTKQNKTKQNKTKQNKTKQKQNINIVPMSQEENQKISNHPTNKTIISTQQIFNTLPNQEPTNALSNQDICNALSSQNINTTLSSQGTTKTLPKHTIKTLSNQRNYTKEEINSFFTDITKIQFD